LRPPGLIVGDSRRVARSSRSGFSAVGGGSYRQVIEISLLIGGRLYLLPERSAACSATASAVSPATQRHLSYVADAIDEDFATGGSPEPIDGTTQIETLAE
jgi:hypothetical protein